MGEVIVYLVGRGHYLEEILVKLLHIRSLDGTTWKKYG